MKIVIVLGLFTIAYALYTDMDETLDLGKLLEKPEEALKYINCWLDKQPCTKQMEIYKNHIKEIFATSCAECDDRAKHMSEEFILDAFVKYPKELNEMRAKYDPNGAYFNKLAIEVAKY